MWCGIPVNKFIKKRKKRQLTEPAQPCQTSAKTLPQREKWLILPSHSLTPVKAFAKK
jgi:hypothetical protein